MLNIILIIICLGILTAYLTIKTIEYFSLKNIKEADRKYKSDSRMYNKSFRLREMDGIAECLDLNREELLLLAWDRFADRVFQVNGELEDLKKEAVLYRKTFSPIKVVEV